MLRKLANSSPKFRSFRSLDICVGSVFVCQLLSRRYHPESIRSRVTHMIHDVRVEDPLLVVISYCFLDDLWIWITLVPLFSIHTNAGLERSSMVPIRL